MKLSANVSSHCTDYEIACDRNVFGCFTPNRSPQSLNYDVIFFAVTSELEFWTSAGGKVAEKSFVTYDFVISAM